MKNKLTGYIFAVTYILLSSHDSHATMGIANRISGGYFGDNVSHYIKCKWLAYKYNLKFYFQPFQYAADLNAYTQETMLTPEIANSFQRHISITHEAQIPSNLYSGTLMFLEPYSPGFEFGTEDLISYLLLNSPADFLDNLKFSLQPWNKIPELQVSKKMISVAVHIRKRVPSDNPLYSIQEYDSSAYNLKQTPFYLKRNNRIHSEISLKALYADIHDGPMKFPPTQYYIDQIKKISEFFNDSPLYVQIFTSDTNSQMLYESIKRAVGKNNIIFAQITPNWNSQVVEDCYLMSTFDCLIKSISTFSSISQIMGDHAITIFPGNYFWDNNKLVIQNSFWFIREEKLKTLQSNSYGE